MLAVGWALFALGLLHVAYGLVRFRRPLADAWAAGFVGQFAASDARRAAFWFLLAGPLLMALGQVAVHAVSTSDAWLLGVIGGYLLAFGAVGVAAFPRSPLWAPVALGPIFLAASAGWLG